MAGNPSRLMVPRRLQLRRAAAGFTLFEALLALGTLSLGALALAEIQVHTLLAAEATRERAAALALAQATLEQQRRFTVLEPAGGATSYAAVASFSVAVPPEPGRVVSAHLELEVVEHPARHLKSLRVTVSWPDRLGRTQRVRLDTLLARAPP
jgi:hypothetical protein